jgi:unsaturated rhamnogalacturonyl hydrolase
MVLALALLTCTTLMGSARPAVAASAVYQAEDAVIVNGVVAANHTGYTGTGFVDYGNAVGGYVQFTVSAAQAGPATLGFRVANGTTTDRPMSIAVNGVTVVGSRSFPGTGSWNTWQTVAVPATLAVGANTVRATATTAGGGPNLDSLTVGAGTTTTDWSVAMVDSTMSRFTPATIGGWSYPVGLYLYGQYLVYQRTHDPALLAYIKAWVDRFVDGGGNIDQTFDSLDSMEAGRLLVVLHHETGDPRYAKAATTIRDRLTTYPRTADGGFWHATTSSRAHQLWGDGTFMLNPFLVEYGREFNDATYADAEAVKQLTVYGTHLQQPGGLLRHAYDESKAASWADPGTGLSPEVWCRADGWYGMAMIDVLDNIPATQPGRAQLLTILDKFAAGLQATQDPVSGRWFQVMDKGTKAGNWTETSCSSMFAFTLSRAAQQGYIDAHYAAVAQKAYQGVLARVSLGSDGRTNLTTISIGTNVGDYAYYAGRTQATNDFHGLGSFLIMNEQLAVR